jgi:serine protease AprX
MTVAIPRSLVDYILLGPEDDRRQLQDSPILGDVWIAFAARPGEPQDLLITPYKSEPASGLAVELATQRKSRQAGKSARIAHLQGVVAAQLTFDELITLLLPMTSWWSEKKMDDELERLSAAAGAGEQIARVVGLRPADNPLLTNQRLAALDSYVTLIGLIAWAGTAEAELETSGKKPQELAEGLSVDALARAAGSLFAEIRKRQNPRPLVYIVSLNRKVQPALERSVPAVKADAARTVFAVKCSEIGWAVLDSGIDASHPGFGKRVVASFDFTRIRDLTSLDMALDEGQRNEQAQDLAGRYGLAEVDVKEKLTLLAEDAKRGRSVDWNIAEHFVTVPPGDKGSFVGSHGTHVAGIIGAEVPEEDEPEEGEAEEKEAKENEAEWPEGLCPDIKLYDFRVLGRSEDATEFAVIAALQFIRYLNERNGWVMIHGANLSLSIPHDVRNYACGRTPVCDECERLVGSGVVVVAAAGNRGYQSFETRDGVYEGYAAFSVTDPGNAESVITVGSTHRYWPHTYGVSFFSSRGPTGDGRIKPDLVAPGEKIISLLPGEKSGPMDGTSMAAPHVSGAAAMLMARYSELIGQPRRIKRILCESATDLGRERSFQGHGMLDVLRAFQSI